MTMEMDTETKALFDNDPQFKEAAEKAHGIFQKASLSQQITMKIWAAMILCKRRNVDDHLITDLVSKFSSMLKFAHTIELTEMFLKEMHGDMEQEFKLAGGKTWELYAGLGATLEIVHNHAAQHLKNANDQVKNILDLIPKESETNLQKENA